MMAKPDRNEYISMGEKFEIDEYKEALDEWNAKTHPDEKKQLLQAYLTTLNDIEIALRNTTPPWQVLSPKEAKKNIERDMYEIEL